MPVSESEVTQGHPDVPNVALVFNVGAGYEPAPAILDTLAEREYRATFFVMGWWAERHPDELRPIADAGHQIASHGHRIFDLSGVYRIEPGFGTPVVIGKGDGFAWSENLKLADAGDQVRKTHLELLAAKQAAGGK